MIETSENQKIFIPIIFHWIRIILNPNTRIHSQIQSVSDHSLTLTQLKRWIGFHSQHKLKAASQRALRQVVGPEFLEQVAVGSGLVRDRQGRQSLPELLRQSEVPGSIVLKLRHLHLTLNDQQMVGLWGGQREMTGTGTFSSFPTSSLNSPPM